MRCGCLFVDESHKKRDEASAKKLCGYMAFDMPPYQKHIITFMKNMLT